MASPQTLTIQWHQLPIPEKTTCAKYPFSHNHGSVKMDVCSIGSDNVTPFEYPAIFHGTMIVEAILGNQKFPFPNFPKCSQKISFPKRKYLRHLCHSCTWRQAPKTKAGGHGKPSFTEARISGGRRGEGLDGLEVRKAFMIKCLLCHLSSYGFFVLIWMDFGMTQKGKNHPLGFFLGGNNFGISNVFWM